MLMTVLWRLVQFNPCTLRQVGRLDDKCFGRLLAACAQASGEEVGTAREAFDVHDAAREALRWTLRSMVDGARGAAAAEEAQQQEEDDEFDELEALLQTDDPPWHAHPSWLRDVLRTLGNVRDFEAARMAFGRAPVPRARVVWEEMIRVCNLCGEPAFASEVLSESFGMAVADAMSAEVSPERGGG